MEVFHFPENEVFFHLQTKIEVTWGGWVAGLKENKANSVFKLSLT
jgi:hypothetical protein